MWKLKILKCNLSKSFIKYHNKYDDDKKNNRDIFNQTDKLRKWKFGIINLKKKKHLLISNSIHFTKKQFYLRVYSS